MKRVGEILLCTIMRRRTHQQRSTPASVNSKLTIAKENLLRAIRDGLIAKHLL